MILQNKYCIFDFETASLDNNYNQPVSLGAVMVDGRKLSICENGIFYSGINIIPDEEVEIYGLSKVEQKALQVNKLSLEEISKYPPLKKVWGDFTNWINYHNPKKDQWEAPIPCGHNVEYDLKIANRIKFGHHNSNIVLKNKLLTNTKIKQSSDEELAKAYREIVQLKEPWKFGPSTLFHPIYKLDTQQLSIAFFENQKEPHRYNLPLLKEYFGFTNDGAHHALDDALYTAEMIVRYLRLLRAVVQDIEFDTEGQSCLRIEEYIKNNKKEDDGTTELCPF